jgi:hypothetical protein
MNRPLRPRFVAIGGLILGVLVTTLPAAASATGELSIAPAAPTDTASVVRVVPSTGLTERTPVRITARGLPASTPVAVTVCDRQPDVENDCLTDLAYEVATDSRGRLDLDVQIPALAFYDHDISSRQPIYCRADHCAVHITWRDDAGNVAGSVASPPLTFVGSPATITASVAEELVDGQRIRVTGTALGSDAPYVTVLEQRCAERLGQVECDPELPLATVRLRPDDTFAADVRVFREPPLADCVDDGDTIVECYLVARILLNGYTGADETFGVPAYAHPRVEIQFTGG